MEVNANQYNQYDSKQEIEIDLVEILLYLWHYVWIIAICAVATGGIGFCISKFAVVPMYESSTKVYILNKKDSSAALTTGDLQLASQLTKDYAQMITSRSVLETVIDKLQLEETYESLEKRVAVTTPSDTRILAIMVTDPSPLWAQTIADEIRSVASERITNVMDVEAVNTVDYADLPTYPASPSVKKWTAIGFVLGAFVCIVVLFIRFIMDDTIKTGDDVERYLGLSTLALIPMMNVEEGQKEKVRQEKLIKTGAEEGIGEDMEQIEE